MSEKVLTPEKKTPFLKTRKGKRIVIGSSIVALLAASIGVGAYFAITTVLTETQHLPYIRYQYRMNEDEGTETTVEILKVRGVKDNKGKTEEERLENERKSIPVNFYVPDKINGMRVTKIAESAFQELDTIKSVRLPDSITDIGSYAFQGCTNLEKINYGGKLFSLGEDVFTGTLFLTNAPSKDGFVIFSEVIIAYVGIDEFNGDFAPNTALVASSEAENRFKAEGYNVINLKDFGQIKFSNNLFKNKKNLIQVQFPETATYISESLFSGCINLEFVDLSLIAENSSVDYRIGDSAFAGCESLNFADPITNEFKLPSNIVSVGAEAFRGTNTTGTVRLPNATYNRGAFRENKQIEKVILDSNTTTISDFAFEGCENLVEITALDAQNNEIGFDNIETIGQYALSQTAIREFRASKQLQTIDVGVFKNCFDLEKVYLYNNSVGFIEDEAFMNNDSLSKIILLDDDGTELPSTHDVMLPRALVRMSTNGLNGESALFANAEIFGGTAYINDYAPEFKSVLIPYNIQEIGKFTFFGNTNLELVEFEAIPEGESIPNFKLSIGASAFSDCTSLEQVKFSSNVNRLGANSFNNCLSLKGLEIPTIDYSTINEGLFVNTGMINFVIPKSVRTIRTEAFKNNTALVSVVIPLGNSENPNTLVLTTMEENAFSGNPNLHIFVEYDETLATNRWKNNWSGDATVHYNGTWHYVDGVPTVL